MMTTRSLLFSKQALVIVLGGLLFLGFFYLRYPQVFVGVDYPIRDDGAIALSHGKNLVDYGFIGVNPSGPKVEGHSAPLQCLLYAVLYYLFGIGFIAFAKWQTIICTFLLGCVFTSFFIERPVFALLAATGSSYLLTTTYSLVVWHVSGMENAITHVLFLTTVLILFYFAQSQRIRLWLAVIPFLASISRVESMFHLLPILLIFALYWQCIIRRQSGWWFMLIVVGLWSGVQWWRYWYFGDILPNTAYAQGISVKDRLVALFALNPSVWYESCRALYGILVRNGGWDILFFLPCIGLMCTKMRWRKEWVLLAVLAGSLIMTALLHPFIFGPARLDWSRTTSHFALFVVLFMGVCCYVTQVGKALWYALLLFFSLVVMLQYTIHRVVPILVCDGLSSTAVPTFHRLAQEQSIQRATGANFELGNISWHKFFNVVDLAKLGSPFMAKLPSGPLMADYLFAFAAPDFMQFYGNWCVACRDDKRLRQDYQWMLRVWVRKAILKTSQSAERKLLDDLQQHLSLQRIAKEITQCEAQPRTPDHLTACVYIARTVYRFIPEFRQRGEIAALSALFQQSRTRPYDEYLINGYRDATLDRPAIQFIREYTKQHP